MAIIHDDITIESASRMPSLGMLIGSRASSDVFDSVNSFGHKSFFGSDFDHISQEFFNRHVRPMDQLTIEISNTVNMILNPDQFRILDTMEALQSTPPCMEMSILLYEPVRKLFEQGRVEGYGYNPDTLPDEDVYGRLIDNFTCEDVAEASDEEGYYTLTGTLYSTDPDLDDDSLYAIRRSREYILNKVLAQTDRDPTAIDLPRG